MIGYSLQVAFLRMQGSFNAHLEQVLMVLLSLQYFIRHVLRLLESVVELIDVLFIFIILTTAGFATFVYSNR